MGDDRNLWSEILITSDWFRFRSEKWIQVIGNRGFENNLKRILIKKKRKKNTIGRF